MLESQQFSNGTEHPRLGEYRIQHEAGITLLLQDQNGAHIPGIGPLLTEFL